MAGVLQGSTAGTGRALGWQQEAGVCPWLCAKGASQAMGTALPGQGCECQVQAVPLQGWHQTQLPAELGAALSQLLPLRPCAVCTPGSVGAHKGCQCSLLCPQGGSPVPHCSVQHMVECAPVPTSACFPVLPGLLLAMTCCCGAQTAELLAPIGIPEPLLSMGLLTLPQLYSSTTPSAPAPCCHCSQGLEELGGSWLGGPA
ncbi:hypothetical protein EK904_005992 [Melospiza melodia maxima]|nr:hypothetical protein EK904_005992 [Melospiza melodia maxima]